MKINHKYHYAVLTLFTIVIFLTIQQKFNNKNTELTCSATLHKTAPLPDGLSAVLNASIYLFLGGKGQGSINYDGEIVHQQTHYRVKRLVAFTYSHRENATVYGVSWRGVDVANEDTLPPGALTQVVTPAISRAFYRFQLLDKKTLLILQDGVPDMVCIIE